MENALLEKWKKITGCSNYEVSDTGRVRNVRTGKLLKQGIDKYGYLKISILNDDGGKRYSTIHRLVAEEFVPGWDANLQVNHIDGNKLNPRADNLEWVTAHKNHIHAVANGLNANANRTLVEDLESGQTLTFNSIKSAANYINIHANNLIPLIRRSKDAPLLGRWIVKLEDEQTLFCSSNSAKFGTNVFVLDCVNGERLVYPSYFIAAYFTGIRSLSNIFKIRKCAYIAGYYVALNEDDLPTATDVCKEEAMAIRESYQLVPYRAKKQYYELYDYYTKTTTKFYSTEAVAKFVNEHYGGNYDQRDVSTKLGECKGRKGTTLIHGLGLRSSLHRYAWYPFTEETILSSYFKCKAPMRMYRVTNGSTTKLVQGDEALLDELGIADKRKYFSLEYVYKQLNDPNIHIVRLNKPIQN
jgi:hypothetical protein